MLSLRGCPVNTGDVERLHIGPPLLATVRVPRSRPGSAVPELLCGISAY